MKVTRTASVPLITHDPYFSIWLPSDHLYDEDTVHWCKHPQRIYGFLTIDGQDYCFLGRHGGRRILPQTELDITATSTSYIFENDRVRLHLSFTSPLLLDDPILVSRPCTYVDIGIEKKREADVSVRLELTSDLVACTKGKIIGRSGNVPGEGGAVYTYASMEKADQTPLGHSGDNITIDWGTLYLAANQPEVSVYFDQNAGSLKGEGRVSGNTARFSFVVAYDDLLSIYYLGSWKKAYWTTVYPTILNAIAASFADRKEVLQRANKADQELERCANASGGADYAYLSILSYRQSIAAHKLIADDNGDLLFLSKENDSNGCIGTVDVSYPSVPLYLLHSTEYVKGMLRPIFAFAALPVWEYNFAPHDVGRYPYAAGQVYGLKDAPGAYDGANGCIFPFYHQYPAGSDIYDFSRQMPVEECGNMLIMTAAVCVTDKSASFATPYEETLKCWTDYLLTYGSDPGEQLCTDDFAGHLAHNVNLSAKAVMGVEAYAQICRLSDREAQYKEYHEKAKAMAESLAERADDKDHSMLAYKSSGSWSLKYNLVWDRFFGSHLFSEEMIRRELDYYIKKSGTYGVPLDGRRNYTKSDWILWCAALTDDKAVREALIAPIAKYQHETPSRLPFSDWYDTDDGTYCAFIARSVQGGIFMPMLIDAVVK